MDPRRHNPPPDHPATEHPSSSYTPIPRRTDDHPRLSPRTTSLPSIHHLHPDLPPATLPPHPSLPSNLPNFHSGYTNPPGQTSLGVHPAPDDSDPDDQQGPPKKKRRRQALSCTECKRRKIKCDRAQPCGPCSRRGEQQKCQWHIIEPMEKYVTRVEYDELKAKVEELQNMVNRMLPNVLPSIPYIHPSSSSSTISMTPGPTPDSVQGTAITPYHQASSSSLPTAYHNVMPTPRSPTRGESTQASGSRNVTTTRSPPQIYRHSILETHPPNRNPPSIRSQHIHSSSIPPPLTPRASSSSPVSNSRLPPPSRTNITPSRRRSSLSLAEITSPYNPDNLPTSRNHPKNLQAQTLPWLGQRLRKELETIGSAQSSVISLLLPLLLFPLHLHLPPHILLININVVGL
ncbi:hypothetical protein C8Q75DRAFT_1773 [Abortiporus biennis]|nr:hypothetical protein C8Q75DRAFT_1773 [Abortiporus biennis]